jgi:hypothetical protein
MLDTVCESFEGIGLAQDKFQGRAIVKTVMNYF